MLLHWGLLVTPRFTAIPVLPLGPATGTAAASRPGSVATASVRGREVRGFYSGRQSVSLPAGAVAQATRAPHPSPSDGLSRVPTAVGSESGSHRCAEPSRGGRRARPRRPDRLRGSRCLCDLT